MNSYASKFIIQNPEDFCNRKTEVKKIFSRIGGSRPQSISVVGERRIGKSSLLHHIYNEKVRKDFLKDFKNYIFVFCDLQMEKRMDVDSFLTLVSKKITEEAPEFSKKNLLERVTYDSFLRLVQDLDKRNRKVVFVFDRFDVVTNNKEFGPEFFSYLRSLANSYNVAYITSSRKDLQESSRNGEIKDSPFFNIFTYIPLGLFDKKSALELISKLSKREGIPLESYAKFIFGLAGFHPFFLQIACSKLSEYLGLHKSINEEGFQTVEENFLDEAKSHFGDMVKDLKGEEQECLKTVAQSGELDQKLKFLARKLERRGFLTNDNEGYKIFSKSFRDFILGTTKKKAI